MIKFFDPNFLSEAAAKAIAKGVNAPDEKPLITELTDRVSGAGGEKKDVFVSLLYNGNALANVVSGRKGQDKG